MFENLNQYMLTNKNIIEWTNNIFIKKRNEKKYIKEEKCIKKNENSYYKQISKKDGLFWSFFYILNGPFEYISVFNDFSTEKLYKINLVDKVRENKQLLKKYKFKINDVEDKLLNCEKIDIPTFICLCLLHNINFILKDDKFYWKNVNNIKNINIIKIENKEVYIYDMNEGSEEVYDKIESTSIEAATFHKKIKSISNYKMLDLSEISKKLGIKMYDENGKKIKKKDIYYNIQQFI